jgi:hypothetical protein
LCLLVGGSSTHYHTVVPVPFHRDRHPPSCNTTSQPGRLPTHLPACHPLCRRHPHHHSGPPLCFHMVVLCLPASVDRPPPCRAATRLSASLSCLPTHLHIAAARDEHIGEEVYKLNNQRAHDLVALPPNFFLVRFLA